MNERIIELAEQSGMRTVTYEDDEETYFTESLDVQKFAELIVGECRIALNPMLRDMVSRGQAYDLIKKHFGVKE